jgi:hypothetical protein
MNNEEPKALARPIGMQFCATKLLFFVRLVVLSTIALTSAVVSN